ncbi:MAG TPA: DUF3306 domain-containing protein [Burkholderiales bacterium]|nr:DUF3306 domain-containing protein [Burkholderiales bacterium]
MADSEKKEPATSAPAAEDPNAPFLSRWSRLKQEARDRAVEKPRGEPAAAEAKVPPELPPLDQLTIDSDYRAFFHPKVGEDVRRAALKKLFSDPRFNVMDGLDVYIDDYSKTEPIPAAMLAGLRQAQKIFGWAQEDREQREKDEREKAQAAVEDARGAGERPAGDAVRDGTLAAAAPDPASVPSSDPGERTKS